MSTDAHEKTDGAAPPPAAFNWWPWSPLFVIGAAAIANGAMLVMANEVRPEKVEAQPYVASSRIDGEKISADRFVQRGFELQIRATDKNNLSLAIPANKTLTTAAQVYLYRPDSSAHDRHLIWDNPTLPFPIVLERPGLWRFQLTMQDEQGADLRAESAIDTIAVTTP